MTEVLARPEGELRELVPSARELAQGVTAARARGGWATEDTERRTPREVLRGALRDLDPRLIPGSKLPVAAMGVSALLSTWEVHAVGFLLPEIRSTFGVSLTFLLTLGSLATVVTTVLAIPLGYVADRTKRVRLVQASAVIGGAAILGSGLAQSPGQLAGARAALGVGGALQQPASQPLLSDCYPPSSRARVFAVVGAAAALGQVVAGPGTGYLNDAIGWRATLALLGSLSLLSTVLLFLVKEPRRGYWDRLEMGASEEVALREQRPASLAEGLRAAWSVVTVRRLCYAMPFITIGGLGLQTILYLYYAQVFQLTSTQRGNLATIGATVALLGLLAAGPVADRLLRTRPGRVMTFLGVIMVSVCAGLTVLALSPWLWLSVLSQQPIAFAQALTTPALAALLSLVVPARIRGVGLQIIAPFTLVGLFAIPLLGPIADDLGIRKGMFVFIPFIFVGALIFLSSASGVERDIRAAAAASMAEEEAARAKADGGNKLIICRDVDVLYENVQVLFGLDFDVEEGECVALLGTNGSGKSTLLRAICGLQEASNGAVFYDGHDITHAPASQNAERGIVVMPGGQAVFPGMTVAENLRAAGWLLRDQHGELEARTQEVLGFFPVLQERWNERAGNLSGGEQQMVGLGQALIMKPRLLMIDELSLGLAPTIVERLLGILRVIHERGTTVVLVEQSLNVAVTIADRAVYMEKGEVRFSGPTEELLARPDLVRSVFMGGAVSGAGPARRARVIHEESQTNRNVLEAVGVSVSFGGVQAVSNASLHVAPSEIVGIIGANGAGKTTMFDLLSGFTRPDSGRILLDGVDVTALGPDARARLGLARSFQNARLFPGMTVRETIAVAFERRSVRSALLAALWMPSVRSAEQRMSGRIDDLVELMGLAAYQDKFVSELSTGTRRAVDIACIMAFEPSMLLLDEPSSGLAQAEAEQLGPLIQRVARDAGCAVLLIEHDLPLVCGASDRLVAMDRGTTVVTGTPAAVVSDPRVLNSYLAASEDVLARSGTRMAQLAQALTGNTPHASGER